VDRAAAACHGKGARSAWLLPFDLEKRAIGPSLLVRMDAGRAGEAVVLGHHRERRLSDGLLGGEIDVG
jgi:hypothetical protein